MVKKTRKKLRVKKDLVLSTSFAAAALIVVASNAFGTAGSSYPLAIGLFALGTAFAIMALVFGVITILNGDQDDASTFIAGLAIVVIMSSISTLGVMFMVRSVDNNAQYGNCIAKYDEWNGLIAEKSATIGQNPAINISKSQIEDACRDSKQRTEVINSLNNAVESLTNL
ncbi:MAG: hypothetical protein LBK50_00640 [Candidatus Nomurabacteria bacterium]|jgi:hypothetical protein|nr:hypothetical protein [Candidatus Nomurabacteria bacterium]